MNNISISILSTIGLCVIATNVSASPFNGPYAGVMAGYETFHDSFTDTGLGPYTGLSTGGDLAASSPNAGLFAGYGHKFNNLYLGTEAEGDIGHARSKTNITVTGLGSIYTDVQHKYDYGISLRPGFFPTENTLLYGRIGIIKSEFDDKATNHNASLTGGRFGVGAETLVSQNATVRADWVYTDYQSHNYTDAFQTADSSTTGSTFRIGLAYNF